MYSIFKTFLLFLTIGTVAYAADTASILPPAETTFTDANGKPLTKGTVDFYIPTTTTRKATWQDASETILNTNPVVLNDAGRALILGSGSYRQVVKDRNGNTIWDQVTSSTGSGGGSTPTATGDGDLVGTIKTWAGLTAPNQYMFTYGQEVSRTTFATLLTAITSSQAVFCNSGDPIISGLSDTTNFNIGVPIELSCVVGGFTSITAKTSTTVTLALTPNVTANVTAIFFPWGNGNHTTTFNIPDYRGLAPIGNNNMGGVASSNMTITYFGTNPNSIGGTGGAQSTTLGIPQLPPFTPAGIITNGAITSVFTGLSGQTGLTGAGGAQAYTAGGFASSQIIGTVASSQATSTFAGGAQGGTSTPFSRVMPSQTINLIIKVTPDVNSATASGVTSLGGMTGSIACGTNLLCTGNTISSIAGNVNGPNSTINGNLAFFNDITGRNISGAPTFVNTNPANAAVYSQLANAVGAIQTNNLLQISLGSAIPASQQFGYNLAASPVQQAIVGTVSIAAGDITTIQACGVCGYALTNSSIAGAGATAVGMYGQGAINVANSNAFGGNTVATNSNGGITAGVVNPGNDANFIAGFEGDVNINKKVGNIEPVITSLFGMGLAGGGTSTTDQGDAVNINKLSVVTGARWTNAFKTFSGAAINGINLGAAASGTSQNSQTILLNGTNSAGTTKTATQYADLNGAIIFQPATGATFNSYDGAGTIAFSIGGYGGSNVALQKLATAGIITNTSSGILDTLAGTSTTVLHGNASGLPTYGSVSLTTDVSGSLPAVNGGTGQTAYALGDTLYSPSANTLFRLPGNITAVKQYLSQTGTGTVSAAPVWATIAGTDITGAALTKTDDTNVTLTLGGTPTTALLRASSLTLGWTGTLAVGRGGTGIASGTSGGVPYFSATGTIASSALLTANAIVLGGGAATAPSTLASLGTTTTLLHGNVAGAPTFGAIVSADMNITATSCTNQFVTAISTGGVGTCTTDTLASAQHANQGTTTTVLHGNASGNPSFAAVSLTADISGILPTANGGVDQAAWTTYTPTITPQTGALTSATVTATGRYKQYGKTIVCQTTTSVTNIGIGVPAGNINATLPFSAQTSGIYVGSSYETASAGNAGAALVNGTFTPTLMNIKNLSAATYWVNGYVVTGEVTYELP